ncbi:hypothetical protein GZ77_10565 [Endozoicomonas montiporae]|uniref:Uncharacterized protein n=2 Tax=Endozoicomonas montiporae TaxID=1027273 RepID=A0A081N8G3_9GAMM|nr:hypothetical protein [Endozoicomonas montiporae]AMO55369.1 hypothetical protein EZMO1_1174 [Endozoicomonas montiporae CL-33]KEQ14736.1 hypothetical protein GZ77_10565 [Endozoicomonas montiporae]
MFIKTLLLTLTLIFVVSSHATMSCNIESGVYVSTRDESEPENMDLLFNPTNYSDDLLYRLKGHLMLIVDADKRILMTGFMQIESAVLFHIPVVGRFVEYPKVRPVSFLKLQYNCSGDRLVLSWQASDKDSEFHAGGVLEGLYSIEVRQILVELPQLSHFSFRFSSGEDKKYLRFNKMEVLYDQELQNSSSCSIPDGIYEGIQRSDLMKVEFDDEGIEMTLQRQGVLYNDSPIVPEPLLYDCQDSRLLLLYTNSEGSRSVFVGEWDKNKKVIESLQRFEVLNAAVEQQITLEPVD